MKTVSAELVEKFVEECTENIDEVKIAGTTLFERKNECKSSYTIYVVIIAIVFAICIGICTYFVYYKYMNHWYLKNDATRIKFGIHTQTTI